MEALGGGGVLKRVAAICEDESGDESRFGANGAIHIIYSHLY